MIGFSEDAATPYGAGLDRAAFFAWVQGQQGGRYELKDGTIIMHAGSTKRHARLMTRFAVAIGAKLDPDQWSVTTGDYAVEVGSDIRYPDVLVERADTGGDLSTTAPVLLVEVLSPSSVARDMSLKLAEYTSLASLACYIVASQDEAIVWVWQRDADTGEFPRLPTELSSSSATIKIDALDLDLPLAELYRGIAGA